MWTPNTSNKSNAGCVEVVEKTYMAPNSTLSATVSNESGKNRGLHHNIHESFTPYFHASYASRSSTKIVGHPSNIQQTQGDSSSTREISHVLTNDPSQLSLGSSHAYSSITKTRGGFNIRGDVDYKATQHQKEHLLQPEQYSMGKSPGLMFGAINASQHPLQHDYDRSSISGTGFSFPRPDNDQDLHFHGSGRYQPFQQPQPRSSLYNSSRGKEVAQGSLLEPDDYGLLGMLGIIKGAANLDKTSLAIGVDPHSLGLDLFSLEPLNQKFASPWSDEPVKEGPKNDVPQCYNSKQPPALKRSHFKKFDVVLLFYIFYSMPQDQAQLLAASELHDRGWNFHKELRMWFTRDYNSVPPNKNATYEIGSYICFDPSTWQTIRQENVVLYYEKIEQRPIIPP